MPYGTIHLRVKPSIIVLTLYIISFIGFLENINSESKIKVEYFEKHNININLVKIVILSILSLVLLLVAPSIASAFVLGLTYLIISTIKLIQLNKKKKILILWGIPIIISILLIVAHIGFNQNTTGSFRLGRIENRIISSFNPEIDPFGAGWQGMNQKSIINSANLFGKADNMSEAIQIFNEGTNYPFIALLANYGWIISIMMVLIVVAFNIKLILDAMKIKDTYGKLLILGIACLFILRSMFCILMNLNLGIKADFDIPFISYGKLNLVIDVMSLSIIFSIYRRKDIMLVSNSEPIA